MDEKALMLEAIKAARKMVEELETELLTAFKASILTREDGNVILNERNGVSKALGRLDALIDGLEKAK